MYHIALNEEKNNSIDSITHSLTGHFYLIDCLCFLLAPNTQHHFSPNYVSYERYFMSADIEDEFVRPIDAM